VKKWDHEGEKKMTEGIINRAGLLTLFEYNTYATTELLDTVENLDEEQFSQEISPSQSSIRQILQHMMGTETYFLAVCQGHALDFDPSRYNTLEEIRAYWDGLEHRMRRYIETVDEEDLKRTRQFRFRETGYNLPAWQLIIQAFVHATHHRGELSILLARLGRPLPNIDILLYFAEQKRQQE
jgi:uncharacterized damage-inducible protein DinB